MSKIVNLRTVRKRQARDAARADKTAKAAASGDTPAARAARKAESEKRDRFLDGHLRDPGEP
jgi:Domain of unknown function (DUF4169)